MKYKKISNYQKFAANLQRVVRTYKNLDISG